MEPPDTFFEDMARRLGADALRRRLAVQVDHASDFYGGAGRSRFHIENAAWFPRAVDVLLGLFGLAGRARANTLDYRLRRLRLRHPKAPDAPGGLTILHLSDLHADGIPDRGERLRGLLAGIACDLICITGDFRFPTWGDYREALSATARIVSGLRPRLGAYAVLGNHDFIEMLPGLAEAGIAVLLNESVRLDLDGRGFVLAGVDDPHFYGAADVSRALAGAPPGEFVVLMCHSPEYHAEAAQAGADLFLCGHTHGGQVCLPGGFAPFTNAPCPRRLADGPWTVGAMAGHTSRGAGASIHQARLNCPPEVTLIAVERSSGPPAWTDLDAAPGP